MSSPVTLINSTKNIANHLKLLTATVSTQNFEELKTTATKVTDYIRENRALITYAAESNTPIQFCNTLLEAFEKVSTVLETRRNFLFASEIANDSLKLNKSELPEASRKVLLAKKMAAVEHLENGKKPTSFPLIEIQEEAIHITMTLKGVYKAKAEVYFDRKYTFGEALNAIKLQQEFLLLRKLETSLICAIM